MTDPAPSLGLAHFLARSDALAIGLFALLVGLSVLSWGLIAMKGAGLARQRRRSDAFLRLFWNAGSLDQVRDELATHGATDPFSHLAAHALNAERHHRLHGAARLEEAGSTQDFVTRTIRKVLDEEGTRMEKGLTALATIGATAPFVGLFGTVWGVYHALVAVGMGGAGSLDRIAGPVGEALIMTGVGLAVAVPAVVAYNLFTRRNRVLNARLDAFAFELQTFLATGQTLQASPGAQPVRLPTRAGAAA